MDNQTPEPTIEITTEEVIAKDVNIPVDAPEGEAA